MFYIIYNELYKNLYLLLFKNWYAFLADLEIIVVTINISNIIYELFLIQK